MKMELFGFNQLKKAAPKGAAFFNEMRKIAY